MLAGAETMFFADILQFFSEFIKYRHEQLKFLAASYLQTPSQRADSLIYPESSETVNAADLFSIPYHSVVGIPRYCFAVRGHLYPCAKNETPVSICSTGGAV